MKTALSAILTVVIVTGSASAGPHPNMLLNKNEAAAIKAKISAGQEPWKGAYSLVLREANTALNQAPLSVVYQLGSSHYYQPGSCYDWSNNMPSPCGRTYCDGQVNPEWDSGDYDALKALSNAVMALSLAYTFSGQAKYADKCCALLKTWFTDPASYMEPDRAADVTEYFLLPGIYFAADMIREYPGWNSADKQAFLTWVSTQSYLSLQSPHDNNWENWRQVMILAAGALLDDDWLINRTVSDYKSTFSSFINSAGEMTQELWRTRSLHYSFTALNGMTKIAEIARHRGIDLYGYSVSGKTLELAWDYHAPYALNQSTWPHEQISTVYNTQFGFYELCYNRIQKPIYKQVIDKRRRPVTSAFLPGHVTLVLAAGLSADPVPVEPPGTGSGRDTVDVDGIRVTASDDDGNLPASTLDDNSATRWSAEGDGQWIWYDLGTVAAVNGVDIAFYLGNERQTVFDVLVSGNGTDWTDALAGAVSSGSSVAPEPFPFGTPLNARYIKIVGHGNSDNDWNSYSEVRINVASTEPPVPVDSSSAGNGCDTVTVGEIRVTASGDDGNIPANTLDDNTATRWSSEGDGMWIWYDLGTAVPVTGVTIVFYLGDQRSTTFDVAVSGNGTDWTAVLSGAVSSGRSVAPEPFLFGAPVHARYVKIVGHGNSDNDWNSFTEVRITAAAANTSGIGYHGSGSGQNASQAGTVYGVDGRTARHGMRGIYITFDGKGAPYKTLVWD